MVFEIFYSETQIKHGMVYLLWCDRVENILILVLSVHLYDVYDDNSRIEIKQWVVSLFNVR